MFVAFVNFLLFVTQKMGYWGIVLLMAVESSFIPFPSEIVIPPAAYLAKTGEMNIYLVIIAGTVGSLIGASINYFISATLGRKIIYRLAETRWAKFLLIDVKNIERAEFYFLRYGNISTFVCRLVPAIRQLISIPAGFVRMRFLPFLFYTTLGASIWVSFLAYVGYNLSADFFQKNYQEVKIGLVAVFIVFVFFIGRKIKKDMDARRGICKELGE